MTGLKHDRRRIEPEPTTSAASKRHFSRGRLWNQKSSWNLHHALAPSLSLESSSFPYFFHLPSFYSVPEFLASAFHPFPSLPYGSYYVSTLPLTQPKKPWHAPSGFEPILLFWREVKIIAYLWEMNLLIIRANCCALRGNTFACKI